MWIRRPWVHTGEAAKCDTREVRSWMRVRRHRPELPFMHACGSVGHTRLHTLHACVQELGSGSVAQPLLRKSHTSPSLCEPKEALLDAKEDQQLLSQQQARLATALREQASDDEMPDPATLRQRTHIAAAPSADEAASPFADAVPQWPPSRPVQRPKGARLEYRQQSPARSSDGDRRLATWNAPSFSGGIPQAAALQEGAAWPPRPQSCLAPPLTCFCTPASV